MLAPANSPREIYDSAQLAAREFFGPVGDVERFPASFVIVRSPGDEVAPACARGRRPPCGRAPRSPLRAPAPRADARPAGVGGAARSSSSARARRGRSRRATSSSTARPCCASSRRRGPTSCARWTRSAPENPHGLEGSPMYDGLNVGKRNVTLNLKKPDAVALVKRLVTEWADAVAENFAPQAMKGFGLDYDTLAALKPDLVMIERVPERADRSAQGLPGLRRAGLRARRATTRSPAGPIANRSARTARSPTRSRRATSRPRSRPGCSTGAARARACTSTCRRSSRRTGRLSPWLLDYEVDGVHPPPRRQPARARRARTACSRASTRATSATAGSRSRAGPTTRGRARGLIGLDDDAGSRRSRRARSAKTRSRRSSRRGPRRARAPRSPTQLQALGHRGGAGGGLRRPPRRPAARAPRALRAAHAPVPRRRASTSATASGCRTRRAATTKPGRRSGRTATGCCATSSVAPTARSRRCKRPVPSSRPQRPSWRAR